MMRQTTKWKSTLLALVVGLGLGLGACSDDDGNGNGNGNGNDTGQMDTGEMDTGDQDTGEMDTGDEDTGEMDTGGQDTMADGGDTGPTCMPSDTIVNVSGNVAVHPVSQGGSDTIASTQVTLVSAATAVGGNIIPLENEMCEPAVTTIPSDEMGTDADFTVEKVDTGTISLGLAAVVDDTMDSGNDTFVPTASVIAGAEGAKMDVSGAQLFALTQSSEATLSAAVASEVDEVDGNPGDLLSAGFILGMVVDDQGNPVEGASVTGISFQPGATGEVVYPSADLMSATSGSGATTSSNGLFVAVQAGLNQESIFAEKTDGGTKSCWGAGDSGGSGKANSGVAFSLTLVPTPCP